jgi:hypothetical protein
MTIAVVINYCTNDYRFLSKAIEAVNSFASLIVIPVADHFFDGSPENRTLLELSYQQHPHCQFVEFAFHPQKPYGLHCPVEEGGEDWIHFWHSTSRYIGYHFVPKEVEYILFIDVDEIMDTEAFEQWLAVFPYREYAALKFASYFYFRSASFRAKTFQSNGLMLKRDLIEPESLLDLCERKGVFVDFPGPKVDYVVGLDGNPLCHHYSFVKPLPELLHKVQSWGHYKDKEWTALLAEEFSQPFRGKDCLFDLSYDTVTPLWDPLSIPIPEKQHVALINPTSMRRLDRNFIFGDEVLES